MRKHIAVALTGTALAGIAQSAGAAQNVYYAPATTYTRSPGEAGALSGNYSVSGDAFLFTWDGHNASGVNTGYGWAHTSRWVNFTLDNPASLDIKMTSTTTGSNADYFNPAFSLY